MPARLRIALALLVALAAAAAAAVVALGGGGERDTSSGFEGALRPPGIPPAEFALRDQDGRRLAVADLRGRVVVVSFMYTTCENTCPLQTQQIRGALDDLGHDVPALAVSVDPVNDTTSRARRFLLKQRVTGRMRFLLGTRAQLAPIWRSYGVRPQGQGFEHSDTVVLLDRSGRQRIGFPPDQLTPERLAHDLRRLEAEPS